MPRKCQRCKVHDGITKGHDGMVLCGTCAVESDMGERMPERILTTQRYRQHQFQQIVTGLPDDSTAVSHCDCDDCHAFRVRYPRVASKIEADHYFARRHVLLSSNAQDRRAAVEEVVGGE